MLPLKIKTKLFTLEIFRRGIVFTIASALFASGVNLCNGNIILLIVSIFNKQVFNEENNEYGFWVGLILIVISLFLFYLIIINWRIEIYSKTFLQLRRTFDKYGTAINHRTSYASSTKLRELHTEAYESYKNTVEFLNENQTYLDIETYNLARNINFNIGSQFIELDIYIKEVCKIENDVKTDYRPELANKALTGDIEDLKEKFNEFVTIIKQKEKFKISTN
ncbi:hypothetical protein [Flavobacterium sp. T12S277]|uniref:hypothetical protein n=1 Tax=Flavobacterium sp. T12S277 TaxID=3402752 RepID=UPI003AE33213